jgi:probable HAF family extracellular repeat protein
LGGDNGTAIWLNDSGVIVGQADVVGSQAYHAFRWRKGVMKDLGTIGTDPCSRALMMNSNGQIVGATLAVCNVETTHPFLWENGGPMVDLNALITASSGAVLYEADNINERGEIVASGLSAGCDDRFACGHIFLLVPCDENHPGAEGCDYSLVDATAQLPS